MISQLLIQLNATKKCASQKNSSLFFTAVFRICFSGTLLACTASIDTPLLLSLYRDDSFWQGNPVAVALGTPLFSIFFFHCKPLAEAKEVIRNASLAVIIFVPYFNALGNLVSH